MMKVSVFSWVPEVVQGYQRDLRVRWALEEAGFQYDLMMKSISELKQSDYRKFQPFGQVPIFQDGELTLFESGAILLHIAAKKDSRIDLMGSEGLSKATEWVVAALNSIEPFVMNMYEIELFNPGEKWAELKRPQMEMMLNHRLKDLESYMAGREFLLKTFSVADILMADILRGVDRYDYLEKYAKLQVYLERCLARPAFKKVHASQLDVYKKNEPSEAEKQKQMEAATAKP